MECASVHGVSENSIGRITELGGMPNWHTSLTISESLDPSQRKLHVTVSDTCYDFSLYSSFIPFSVPLVSSKQDWL